MFRNELSNTVGETAGITQDVGSDPTVGEDSIPPMCTMCGEEIVCENCGQNQEDGFLCLEVDNVSDQSRESDLKTIKPHSAPEKLTDNMQKLGIGEKRSESSKERSANR